MTNQNNILTEEEIKELIGSLNWNPSKAEIGAVIDYFWLRPYALKHLEDKEFRKIFVRLIYLHKIALDGYKKADKEVKSLKIERNELSESNNQLKEKNTILEKNIENLEAEQKKLEATVDLERENHLEFVDVSEVWHNKKVSEITEQKDADLAKAYQRVKELEDILLVKNSQIKNLKESKNLKTYKFKQVINKLSRVKNKAQEKFQAFIIQKEKQ